MNLQEYEKRLAELLSEFGAKGALMFTLINTGIDVTALGNVFHNDIINMKLYLGALTDYSEIVKQGPQIKHLSFLNSIVRVAEDNEDE